MSRKVLSCTNLEDSNPQLTSETYAKPNSFLRKCFAPPESHQMGSCAECVPATQESGRSAPAVSASGIQTQQNGSRTSVRAGASAAGADCCCPLLPFAHSTWALLPQQWQQQQEFLALPANTSHHVSDKCCCNLLSSNLPLARHFYFYCCIPYSQVHCPFFKQ